jgi:hypothetical protein
LAKEIKGEDTALKKEETKNGFGTTAVNNFR